MDFLKFASENLMAILIGVIAICLAFTTYSLCSCGKRSKNAPEDAQPATRKENVHMKKQGDITKDNTEFDAEPQVKYLDGAGAHYPPEYVTVQ